jgi:hypothetical protein
MYFNNTTVIVERQILEPVPRKSAQTSVRLHTYEMLSDLLTRVLVDQAIRQRTR